jgi:hypothetical protein
MYVHLVGIEPIFDHDDESEANAMTDEAIAEI